MSRPEIRDRRGQGDTEYGLILVLVGLAAFLICLHLGEDITTFYLKLKDLIQGVFQ